MACGGRRIVGGWHQAGAFLFRLTFVGWVPEHPAVVACGVWWLVVGWCLFGVWLVFVWLIVGWVQEHLPVMQNVQADLIKAHYVKVAEKKEAEGKK